MLYVMFGSNGKYWSEKDKKFDADILSASKYEVLDVPYPEHMKLYVEALENEISILENKMAKDQELRTKLIEILTEERQLNCEHHWIVSAKKIDPVDHGPYWTRACRKCKRKETTLKWIASPVWKD